MVIWLTPLLLNCPYSLCMTPHIEYWSKINFSLWKESSSIKKLLQKFRNICSQFVINDYPLLYSLIRIGIQVHRDKKIEQIFSSGIQSKITSVPKNVSQSQKYTKFKKVCSPKLFPALNLKKITNNIKKPNLVGNYTTSGLGFTEVPN